VVAPSLRQFVLGPGPPGQLACPSIGFGGDCLPPLLKGAATDGGVQPVEDWGQPYWSQLSLVGRPFFWEQGDRDLFHVFWPSSGLLGLVVDSGKARMESWWEGSDLAHLPLVGSGGLVSGTSEDARDV